MGPVKKYQTQLTYIVSLYSLIGYQDSFPLSFILYTSELLHLKKIIYELHSFSILFLSCRQVSNTVKIFYEWKLFYFPAGSHRQAPLRILTRFVFAFQVVWRKQTNDVPFTIGETMFSQEDNMAIEIQKLSEDVSKAYEQHRFFWYIVHE